VKFGSKYLLPLVMWIENPVNGGAMSFVLTNEVLAEMFIFYEVPTATATATNQKARETFDLCKNWSYYYHKYIILSIMIHA
jgi:hypothetical protein